MCYLAEAQTVGQLFCGSLLT